MKEFEKWWQENQLVLQGYISDGIIPRAVWKAALECVLKEANRISDELIIIPMCKELYDFIQEELEQ